MRASEKSSGIRLSHRDQVFAIILVGIIAFTIVFATVLLPIIQNARSSGSGQNSQPQSIYTWGYVLIGNKGTPQSIFFDNPVTGRINGFVGSDKGYYANLLSTYSYAVTIQYTDSSYQYVTCTALPGTVSPNGSSGTTSWEGTPAFRQDFSC